MANTLQEELHGRRPGIMWTMGLIALCASATLAAEEAAPAEGGGTTDVGIFAPKELEAFILDHVKEAKTGALARLRGRQPLSLSPGDAIGSAREHNLNVIAQHDRVAQGREGVALTSAAFDPGFLYSVRDTNNRFSTRSAVIRRERLKSDDPTFFQRLEEDFKTIQNGGTPLNSDVCTIVDGELVNREVCESNTEISNFEEFASFHTDRTNSLFLQFNANKAMNWGGLFGFGININNREKNGYSFFDPVNPFSADDPVGNGTRYQWTSAMSFSFSTPLPFSKGFGRDANPASVNVVLAEVGARRARWQYGATSNSVLAQAQQRYWNLVSTALQVGATVQQRQIIAERASHAERMLELGQTTQYEVRQMQARLENLRDLEEARWGEYVKASNALAEVLDIGRDTFIVPSDYGDALNATHDVNLATALTTSYAQRPEIAIAESDLQSSDVVLESSRINTRPDIQLVMSYAISQSDAVLGYRDMPGSFAKVFSPDRDDFFIGVVYRLPFGNAAAKSQYSQAQLRHIQARAANEQAKVDVSQDVNSALAALASRRSEVDLRKTNLDLANAAYESGVRRRNAGRITEFDLLQTFGNLLDARVAHIQALSAYQAAYADLTRAQGLLAYYPEGSE